MHCASIPAQAIIGCDGVSYSITDTRPTLYIVGAYKEGLNPLRPFPPYIQKSDMKKEKGKGSEDLRLLRGLPTFFVQIKYTKLLYRFYCLVWYAV